MLKRNFSALILILLFSKFVVGDDAIPFTLEKCIQEALANNPALHTAKLSEEAAKEEIGIPRGKYYPEVLFRFGYRRWETHAFLPSGVLQPGFPSFIGPVNDWITSLRTNYTLFDSGLRSSELKAAQAQHAASVETSLQTQLEIVYQVHVAFYELRAAEEGLAVAREARKRSDEHLRLAMERKNAGAVPQADVTRAQVEVASAELDIVSAESSVRIASGKLNELIGRRIQDPIRIAFEDQTLIEPATINIDQSLTQSLEKRPEVQAAQRRVEAKQSQIGAARSEILPKVRAEAGYGWRDEAFFPGDEDWWIGFTLDVPIFDGGSRSHKITKTKIEANREASQLEELKLSVQQEVWVAYSRWIEAHQALLTTNVRKGQAKESLDLTNARYEEGAGTINDLLDAELAMNQAENDLNLARYQLYIARVAFLRASGELTIN